MRNDKWFLVVNTPGVDICHKVDGQELILVENVNYQIADKIIRAVNAHDIAIEAIVTALERLRPKGDVKKDYSGHVAIVTLRNALYELKGI